MFEVKGNRASLSGRPLNGPIKLTCDGIQDELADGCPGVFALGFTDQQGRFCITFVGSADADLKSVLRNHIGTAPEFKFRHYAAAEAAFERECELFHQFMPVGNFLHPERPPGSNWKCPKCGRNWLRRGG